MQQKGGGGHGTWLGIQACTGLLWPKLTCISQSFDHKTFVAKTSANAKFTMNALVEPKIIQLMLADLSLQMGLEHHMHDYKYLESN